MAGYGLDGSDHGNNKNEFKTSMYEKRAKFWLWLIILWMGLIMEDFSLDRSDH